MIAVIMAGRPLTFHDVAQKMRAVLWTWHPGSMGGPAIAETIFGDSVPSGKLTVTFPRTVGQVPIYYNHMNTGRPASLDATGVSDHYTSKYLDVSFTPEYPFGFGLSYTQFKYSNFHISNAQVKSGGTVTVSADVANVGNFEADEIVQLYVRQLAASLTQPGAKELKGFSGIHLKPGEKEARRRLFTVMTQTNWRFHNASGMLVTEPGDFQVWIGGDSDAQDGGSFSVVR